MAGDNGMKQPYLPEDYIWCNKRKNKPLVSVKVCEETCLLKDVCKDYQEYTQRGNDDI